MDTVNRVVPQLIARGKYIRPVLGILVDEGLNEAVARQLNIHGVVILKVNPNSPAEAAGLRGAVISPDGSFLPGDIITAVDAKPLDSVGKLFGILDEYQVGDQVNLKVLRKGQEMELMLKLQAGN